MPEEVNGSSPFIYIKHRPLSSGPSITISDKVTATVQVETYKLTQLTAASARECAIKLKVELKINLTITTVAISLKVISIKASPFASNIKTTYNKLALNNTCIL